MTAPPPPAAAPPGLTSGVAAQALQVAAPAWGSLLSAGRSSALPVGGAALAGAEGAQLRARPPPKPRINLSPFHLSRSCGPISRPLVWRLQAALYSHPCGALFRYLVPLELQIPPTSILVSRGDHAEPGSEPVGTGRQGVESWDCSSGRYPSRPLRRARQTGQAQVLAGEGGSRGASPASSLPAPSERISLSLVPPHPQHPDAGRFSIPKRTARGPGGCRRSPCGNGHTLKLNDPGPQLLLGTS